MAGYDFYSRIFLFTLFIFSLQLVCTLAFSGSHVEHFEKLPTYHYVHSALVIVSFLPKIYSSHICSTGSVKAIGITVTKEQVVIPSTFSASHWLGITPSALTRILRIGTAFVSRSSVLLFILRCVWWRLLIRVGGMTGRGWLWRRGEAQQKEGRGYVRVTLLLLDS